MMQGYLFSPARPAERITEMLRQPRIPRRNPTAAVAA
jgi:hypothetical protein